MQKIIIIIWDVMQTSRCGTANCIINPVRRTRPLNVYMYVKVFCSIFTLSLWFGSWLCTVYMLVQHISTAWYLMYGMIEPCTKCSLILYFFLIVWTKICSLWGVLWSLCWLYCTVGYVCDLIFRDSGIDGRCNTWLIPFTTVHKVLHEPHWKY